MNYELYFLPILARALGGPKGDDSLAKAFVAIEELGQKPSYEEGYRNFCQFMTEVNARRLLLEEHDLRMTVLECATGAPGEAEHWQSLLSLLTEQSPLLKGDYDALCRACGHRPESPHLQLLRDGRQMAELNFETVPRRGIVDDIPPGRYSLKLDTGLVVWEGILLAHDLIWTEAFEGKELALAAEAGEVRRQPSREMKVADTHLLLRVFPGIESGSIEIELIP